MQTFRQMLPLSRVRGQAEYPLVCISIEDAPRFVWRGYLLDSARHFIAKTTVLELLDALAAFKINVFQWHLTDDSAWRLAISKYPQLVKPAAIQGNAYTQAMGHYSASDIREIVNRAKQLHITIVPEIEMPSHAMQAASMLPEASCLGRRKTAASRGHPRNLPRVRPGNSKSARHPRRGHGPVSE